MATPWSPAAAANSGKRVPALRCHSSQVERSRGSESRGCPGGTSSLAIKELARFRDIEYPPTRNSSPAVAASSATSSSHCAAMGTIRAAGAPTCTTSTPP